MARLARGGSWLAVAFCVLLLGSQLARAGHMVFVKHERCAEHGDLVHADHEAAPGAGASHAAPRGGEPAVTGADEGLADSHEHCDALAIRHTPQQVATSVVDLRLLDGYLLPWSLRPGVGERSVELLLLAPKNSPPA